MVWPRFNFTTSSPVASPWKVYTKPDEYIQFSILFHTSMSLLIQKYIIYPSLAQMMIYSSFKVRGKCFFPSDGLFSSSTALSFYLSLSLLKIILIPWVATMHLHVFLFCYNKSLWRANGCRIFSIYHSRSNFHTFPPWSLSGLCMDYIYKISCPRHPGSFSQWETMMENMREDGAWDWGYLPYQVVHWLYLHSPTRDHSSCPVAISPVSGIPWSLAPLVHWGLGEVTVLHCC